ncbi:MAG: FecR domain-containing protein [Pseudomonadota bacterium]
MVSPEQERLLEEATDILLRLHQSPDDPSGYWAKTAFLKRGAEERAAYAMAERAWSATAPKKKPRRYVWLAAAAVVLLALINAPDLRLSWLADYRTTHEISEVVLPSGDRLTLGAEAALADTTDLTTRRLKLLRGEAFFEVQKDGRRFEVSAGDLSIRVLGTSFEVAQIGDAVQVAVTEGKVAVLSGGQRWDLAPGERLRYRSQNDVSRETVGLDRIATWRNGRLVADNMPLGEFAAKLNKHLPGRILVVGSRLSDARITGSYKLTNPLSALRSAVATTDARVIEMPLALTLVISDR